MNQAAIVILNYNGKDFLEQFLPSLIQYSKPHQIYVADNASTDDSVNYIESNYREVRLIMLPENYGYAGGYNKAIDQIQEENLILINSDIEVTENWIEPLLSTINSSKDIVACQPKIRSFHDKKSFEYAGAAGGFIDWLGYPFCRGRIFDHLEEDKGQYDTYKEIFWASGACFAIKKSIFQKVGQFDAQFFAHMEEIDLCWRIQKAGKKIIYCPESTVYHVGGGTLAATNPRKTYLNFRNGLLLLVKNLTFGEFFYKIPIRSLLDGLAILKFLKEGKASHSIAIIKAHLHAFPLAIGYVRKMSSKKNKRGRKLIHNKLIVFEYFLRNKKRFNQLIIKKQA